MIEGGLRRNPADELKILPIVFRMAGGAFGAAGPVLDDVRVVTAARR